MRAAMLDQRDRAAVALVSLETGLQRDAQPELVTPVLQVVHRVITRFLLEQAGAKADDADSGAVTLIQRFGSAANLNIHLHCLVLDGVYRRGAEGEPVFVEAPAPTDEALQAVLHKIVTRTMKLLTRRGVLIEEQGQTYLADNDADSDAARTLRPLQAAACTYRIAFGPRAGQKVLTVQSAMPPSTPKRAWPKGAPGQAKALADLLAETPASLSLDELLLASRARGRWRERLEPMLEMLVVFGKAQSDASGATKRYRRAG